VARAGRVAAGILPPMPTPTPLSDAELIDRIRDTALLRGEFTLRSGRKSRYYLDKYLFETDAAALAALGQRMAARAEAVEGGVDRLAGAELGGVPLVTAASIAGGLPTVLIRNQKKGYGTAKQLEGRLKPGDRVLVLEDIATTGGQVLEAAGVLREAGARVVGILAVIDRQEGARENIEAAGYRFDALLTKSDLGIDE